MGLCEYARQPLSAKHLLLRMACVGEKREARRKHPFALLSLAPREAMASRLCGRASQNGRPAEM
jgi:hypothetical protein